MNARSIFRASLIAVILATLPACATDGQHHRGAYIGAEGGISH